MDRIGELRIHGVSATSPESMLGLRAQRISRDDAEAGYGPDSVEVHTDPHLSGAKAFSWGGLTSGGWNKALWLLLLPFVLVNTAGWAMHPTSEDGRGALDRARVTMLRVAAVLATVLSVQLLVIPVVDIVAWQWPELRTAIGARPSVAAGVGVVLLVIGALWWLNRIRPSATLLGTWVSDDETRYADPTLDASLGDPTGRMWRQAGLIQRLRVLHITAALGALALSTGLMGHDRWVGAPQLFWSGVIVVGAVLVLVAARSQAGGPEPRWFGQALRLTVVAGLVSAIGAVVVGGMGAADADAFPLSVELRVAAVATAAIFSAVVMLGLLIAEWWARWRGRGEPKRAASVPVALAMLGLASIGAAGSSAELLAAHLTGGEDCIAHNAGCAVEVGHGAYALAVSYAAGLLVLLLVAALGFTIVRVRAGLPWTPPPAGDPRGEINLAVLRRMLTQPAATTAWLVGLGLLGSVVALAWWLLDPSSVAELRAGSAWVLAWVAWGAPAIALLWLATVTMPLWMRGLGAAGLVALVGLLLTRSDPVSVVGIPVLPSRPLDVVLWLGLLGPVLAIGLRGWAGVRSREARKQLGILWDLGLFWPRWYHPFTPPTYSDRAVRLFRAEIRRCLEEGPVVVSAHSQGSVIAVAALATMPQEELDRIGLITYGSPVGRLYGEMFGPHVDVALLETLRETLRVGGPGSGGEVRWRNLHRATDPIGGPIVAPHQRWLGDAADWKALEAAGGRSLGDMPDPDRQAHSNYQFTPGYAAALTDVAALLRGGRPAVPLVAGQQRGGEP